MKDDQIQTAAMTTREDEGFLSRWSRRKSQLREQEEEQEEEQEREADATSEQTLAVQQTANVEEVYHPTDEDMPPLETLDEHSDYSGFMSPRVSEELRRLALRKLFHTPGFHFRDGLDDYDHDYTRFEPLGDIITSDMKFQAEMEELKKRRAEAEAAQLESDSLQAETSMEDSVATDTETVATDTETVATDTETVATDTQSVATDTQKAETDTQTAAAAEQAATAESNPNSNPNRES